MDLPSSLTNSVRWSPQSLRIRNTAQSVPLSAVPTLGARTQYPRPSLPFKVNESVKVPPCQVANMATLHVLEIGVLREHSECTIGENTQKARILAKRQVRASGA